MQCVLKPKSHGSGIMVSDYIDEHNGYLRLTEEEFSQSVERLMVCRRKHVHSLSMEKNMKVTRLQFFYLSRKLLSKLLASNTIGKQPRMHDTI